MIDRVHIKNFGCILETELQLTPLHALIGPNDSGKTTVLRALAGMVDSLPPSASDWYLAPGTVQEISLWLGDNLWATRTLDGGSTAIWFSRGAHPARGMKVVDERETAPLSQRLADRKGPARVFRLEPDSLRAEGPLLRSNEPLTFRDEKGGGLAAILDAIRDKGDGSFDRIAEQLRQRYPTLRFLQLDRQDSGGKTVAVELTNGLHVAAKHMSEGMLYFLAVLAVQCTDMPKLILFEEPENGLHPARIADVMGILREISKTTQVVIATHSPLVINELHPDEVTVLTRTAEHGTKATLIKNTPDFEERSKVYALGELWVSYANGTDESALLHGGPRP